MKRVAPTAAIVARRTFATATESARSSGAAVASSAMGRVGKAAAESPAACAGGKAEVFWMRDPKTGNWIPENQFEEVDVVELRQLLLSKKPVA